MFSRSKKDLILITGGSPYLRSLWRLRLPDDRLSKVPHQAALDETTRRPNRGLSSEANQGGTEYSVTPYS